MSIKKTRPKKNNQVSNPTVRMVVDRGPASLGVPKPVRSGDSSKSKQWTSSDGQQISFAVEEE